MELNKEQENEIDEILTISIDFVNISTMSNPIFEELSRSMLNIGIFLEASLYLIRNMPENTQILTFKTIISNMQKKIEEIESCDT